MAQAQRPVNDNPKIKPKHAARTVINYEHSVQCSECSRGNGALETC